MRRTLALCLITLFLVAANAFAVGEARLSGKVIDMQTKEPIAGATIVLEATSGKKVKMDTKTKKDGSYAIFVLDGTLQYKITWSAPDYTSYEDTMKFKIGEPNLRDIQLAKGGAAAPTADAPAAKPQADPAILAYNAGAELANAGNTAEAIAKFDEAIKLKPTFTPAYVALAKSHLKLKNYPKAIENAKKALEVDNEDTDMWAVLEQAYTASGDKAAAADAKKHIPMNAGELFNDAAKLINAGKDSEAEKLLKQAVAADDKMARAYYELGMIYVRAGKNADAKTNLQKYLELEPNGSDAATAKEMMKYLQ